MELSTQGTVNGFEYCRVSRYKKARLQSVDISTRQSAHAYTAVMNENPPQDRKVVSLTREPITDLIARAQEQLSAAALGRLDKEIAEYTSDVAYWDANKEKGDGAWVRTRLKRLQEMRKDFLENGPQEGAFYMKPAVWEEWLSQLMQRISTLRQELTKAREEVLELYPGFRSVDESRTDAGTLAEILKIVGPAAQKFLTIRALLDEAEEKLVKFQRLLATNPSTSDLNVAAVGGPESSY